MVEIEIGYKVYEPKATIVLSQNSLAFQYIQIDSGMAGVSLVSISGLLIMLALSVV
jgi:hypothetical protein